MAKHQDYPARIGAVLLAAALLAMVRQAAPAGSRVDDPGRLPLADSGMGQRWTLPIALEAEVLASLPAAFERRAREARAHAGAGDVPPLSGYDVHMQSTRGISGGRIVMVEASCKPRPPVAASSPADETPSPSAAASIPEACYFEGVYDQDSHRFVRLSFGGLQPAHEFEQVDCAADRFQAATRLAELPAEVLASLPALSGVAEHGERFNETDVVMDRNAPSRRFALAAVDPDRAIVAIERGGNRHNVENWLFERRDGHWDGDPHWTMVAPPNSLQALLHVACKDVPSPPMRGDDVAERVTGLEQADGLHLALLDDHDLGYVLRSRPGTADSEVLRDGPLVQPLPARELRALRVHLLQVRANVLRDQPAWAHLTRFIDALERHPR